MRAKENKTELLSTKGLFQSRKDSTEVRSLFEVLNLNLKFEKFPSLSC